VAAMRLKEDFVPMVDELDRIGWKIPAGLLRGIIMGGDRTRAEVFATASVVLRPYLLPGVLASCNDPNLDIDGFVEGWAEGRSELLEEVHSNADYVRSDGTRRWVEEKPWHQWIKQRGVYETLYITASEETMSLVAPLIVGMLGDIQRAIYKQHRNNELDGRPRNAPVLWAIDELASCPLPGLPVLLRDCGSQGLLLLAACQSLTQLTAKWGEEGKSLQTLFNNIVVLPGIRDRETLELLSLLVGEFDREIWSQSWSQKEKEFNASQSWQRMKRLSPDDIYRGHPYDPDAALVFTGNGWQWVTLQLYYRSHIWPLLMVDTASWAMRNAWISIEGLPYPDLARGDDYRYLNAISPALAQRFYRQRRAYYANVQSWHGRIAADHDYALRLNQLEDERRSRILPMGDAA
jgi:hypothetical protein